MDVAVARHERAILEHGWTLLSAIVSAEVVSRLGAALETVYAEQRVVQIRNGVDDGTDGTVHHLPCAGGAFLELLEQDHGQALLDWYFQGPYILNTYGGLLNLTGRESYVGRVHRDQRFFSGDLHLMVQLLVMLDDFTEENGATWLLAGSHRTREKPSDDEFFARAVRAVGPAGSIVVFDSNLWHAAGVNRSGQQVRAMVLSLVARQRARVPASLDEWYQPASRRMYQPDQR